MVLNSFTNMPICEIQLLTTTNYLGGTWRQCTVSVWSPDIQSEVCM